MTHSFTGQKWADMTAGDLIDNDRAWKAERDYANRVYNRQQRNNRRNVDGWRFWKRVLG